MGDKSGDESPADAEDSPSQPAAREFSAMATSPPLVENGYEVVGPTLRKPANPHPGQRYLDTDLDTYSIYNGTSWLSVNTSAGIGVIDDIGDVTITGSAEVGQFLGWDGDEWSNLTIGLDDLDDVEIATPDATHVLKRSGSGWANARLSTADLSDILLTAPSDGQFLRYDSGVGKIVNETVQIPADSEYFVVTAYGAKGDGTTDDTAAIQATVNAAVAYQSDHGAPAVVFFPNRTYIVQDPTSGSNNAGAITVPAAARDLVITGYGATLKIGPNGVSTSTLRIFGSRIRVMGLTIDANSANAPPSPSGGEFETKANTGFEVNGSGSVGVQGTDVVLQDCAVVNADKGLTAYSTGTILYDHSGGASERLVTITGGTLPGWVNTDCAITIGGVRYPIASVLSTTTLTLGASSNNFTNNPGADVGPGAAYTVSGYPTVTHGEECFVMVQATRSTFRNCLAMDASWQAFRVRGNQCQVVGCTAINHLGNALRIMAADDLYVSGFRSYSNRNDGRSGIIADAGSSADSTPLDDSDVRTKRLYITDSYVAVDPDGDFVSGASALKVASCYEAHIARSTFIGGYATNNIGVRIEDSVRLVTLEKCRIEPNILFTPAGTGNSVYNGAISGHADAGGALAGYVRYTVTGGGGLVNGKTLFVRGSGVPQYDGPQIVLSAGGGSIVTDRPYVAGDIGAAAYAQTGCDTFKLRDCTIVGMGLSPAGTGAAVFYNQWIENCIAYNVDIENCKFQMKERANIKMNGILTDYDTENAWNSFRLVRNEFSWNSDKLCRAVRGSTAAQMLTSGRITAYGNTLANRHTGAVALTNTYEGTDATEDYDERAILFASDGERPGRYVWGDYPRDATGVWQTGDYIRNASPAAGKPEGWYCIAGGSPGTWRALPYQHSLHHSIAEVGNVGSGEDDLMSYALPAGTLLRNGDAIEVDCGFTFAENSNNKQVKVYWGDESLYDSGDAAQNGGSLAVRFMLVYGDGILGKYWTQANASPSGAYASTGAAGTISVNPANAITIKGTGEADNDGDIVMEVLKVTLHRAP